ncbi:MAG: PilZ domain-containing protein [Desulfobulbaceae bacterium]|nr:PilZ domain-containing protein [Desulfobulbaceae bacterium]
MMSDNNREYPRIDMLNLLSYECMDDEGSPLLQGMGRILDISRGGVKIETHVKIELRSLVLMKIGFKDEIIDVKGEVVYCRKVESAMFESGVRFLGVNDRLIQIIEGVGKS